MVLSKTGGILMRINLFLAKIFRRIFGRKVGKYVYLFFWFMFFDFLVRPLILKINLVLNSVIKVSDEKGIYLQSLINSDPLSSEFWLDPYVLPVVIVVTLAYLLTIIVPFILSIQAGKVFK